MFVAGWTTRAWISSVGALPMTFVIYLVEAAFAVVAALPVALEFTHSAPQGRDAAHRPSG